MSSAGGRLQVPRLRLPTGDVPSIESWRARFLERAPSTLGVIAGAFGVVSLVDVAWPHHWRVLSDFAPMMPGPARATLSAFVAVSGLLLLRVSVGLRKAKLGAWRVAVAACATATVAHLLRGDDRWVEAATAAALLTGLLVARSRFTKSCEPRTPWLATRVALEFLGLAVGYGLLLVSLPRHVPSGIPFGERLLEVVRSLCGLGGALPIRGDRYADMFHATMLGFGVLVSVCWVALTMRPARPEPAQTPQDRCRLRVLLAAHGARDSLGYFALRADKSLAWSASGKAAIAYRTVCGVALVGGDPIGDPEAWPGAIAAFRAIVERHGWTPAVIGCSELGATVFQREYDLRALVLGDEAILRAAAFSLCGRAMRGVRQACAKLDRAGYTTQVRRVAELTPGEVRALQGVAAAWRGDAVERGYSMALSRLGDPQDPDCVVVTAQHGGALCGVLHFVPWGADGISLDLMRRDRNADNGLNEFMIAAVMRACPALGVTRVSLNFAVFRDALERGSRIGAGPVLRLWRKVLLTASRWWQIDSLYRFNAKFHPDWQPRFICYPAAANVPRVAFAALRAEAFIVRPGEQRRIS